MSILFNGSLSCRGAALLHPKHPGASLKEMKRGSLLFVAGGGYFEDGEESFLRDVYLADALHALFAFFLFLEKFAFA
jgi:hypothetical protein